MALDSNEAREANGRPKSAFAYTPDRYAQFLSELRAAGYEFVGFDGVEPGAIVVRHDVDLSLERARAMARVEADLGVKTTYCPLLTAPVYDPLTPENRAILDEIGRLGHDIGLHFDVHRRWGERPTDDELAAQVERERRVLEEVTGFAVTIVSFHRPPTWTLDATFGGFEHAYQPAYFSDIDYVSDSNQKWRAIPPFRDGLPEAAQILVHPGLWSEEDRSLEEAFRATKRDAHADVDRYVDPMGKWLHRR